ncbi:MAG: hybrid sensor histidine kinase/response regulator [Pseudomonadota bacterium]|jgi:two-component system sensor histidine kinase/response regulator|nr:MAG: hybrid sensor histidine kinase/response regulator [Pseudomonadota bacterium]
MNITRRNLPPVKFLVVDDLEDNLLALSALMREMDVEILAARSGREALELLLGNDVALALLDVQMPEMDGFELAELMRGSERTRHVPIIFITAGVRDAHRHFRGYEAGAVDFLYKPIDPHILRSKAGVFHQLHRQRQQLDAHLAELSETLHLNEVFAAVLGHDLRNPLSAIVASAHVLRQNRDPGARDMGQRVLNSARRMARLIEDLLDFSRARLAGGITVRAEPGDLGEMTRRVLQEHQAAEPGRRIELTQEGSLQGFFDGERVAQMASNLLGNALQHGRCDGEIRVHLDGTEPAEVRLSVSNPGEIPPQLLEEIFEPFRSRRERRCGRGEGLGLGLYIVQQLARAHGGEVSVSSGGGQTCFSVAFPRRAGH